MSGVISGACIVSKLSGMVYIREDDTPLVIEWNAIDQLKKVTIPLSKLTNLQASKESTPKLMLKLFYKAVDGATNEEKDKDIKFTFSNRPTMNNIKDALQAILARLRTTIKDVPTSSVGNTPVPPSAAEASATPVDGTKVGTLDTFGGDSVSTGTPAAKQSPSPFVISSDLDFSNPKSLSDENLLKNHALQQKLLFEDKNLRDKFTQAVINFKLSPSIFWQTRLNQLRTYALTTSQHRGAYNVLSTIKPVATSDNQVNVNVTRDMINEIFETYPIIKKLFDDLVPLKFPEGEFWSRFFNSKLFRRLRGDRINNTNQRSDVILDKYLYVDQNFIEEEQKKRKREDEEKKEEKEVVEIDGTDQESKKLKTDVTPTHVNKFIDLVGNEDDNSQKLGNKPDITMRYGDSNISNLLNSKNKREIGHSSVGAGVENEMLVIMRNMNKLSEKIVATTERAKNEREKEQGDKGDQQKDKQEDRSTNEYASELGLNDLHEPREVQFIELNINTNAKGVSYSNIIDGEGTNTSDKIPISVLKPFLRANKFNSSPIDLTDTFATKKAEIDKTSVEINSLIKQNFRSFRMSNNNSTNSNKPTTSIITPNTIQEILTIHITSMELLSHFWRGFNSGDQSQAVQTRKIVISLKKCLAQLDQIENQCVELINQYSTEEKTREKLTREVKECLECDRNGLNRACREYGQALAASERELTATPTATDIQI